MRKRGRTGTRFGTRTPYAAYSNDDRGLPDDPHTEQAYNGNQHDSGGYADAVRQRARPVLFGIQPVVVLDG